MSQLQQAEFNVDIATAVPSTWTYSEGFPQVFYRGIQEKIDEQRQKVAEGASNIWTMGAVELWDKLSSGDILKEWIPEAVNRLNKMDTDSIPVRKRLKIVQDLLKPSGFPKPEVVVQECFSPTQVLRWVESVLPIGSVAQFYDNFRWNCLPVGATHMVGVDFRNELLNPNQLYCVMAQVAIKGDFGHIGVVLPSSYIIGKTCEAVLMDMRYIFGTLYRKELFVISG